MINEFTEHSYIEATDCTENVFKNVKLLGHASANGYVYDLKAMESAVPMYEGVPIFIDHATKGNTNRSYNDRIGYIQNPRLENNSIMGDAVWNPHHPRYEQVLWDAKQRTNGVGFSHCVRAELNTKTKVMESIHSVISVDLVSTPATTKNIFESIDQEEQAQTLLQEEMKSLKAELEAVKTENQKQMTQITEIQTELKKVKAVKPQALAPTMMPAPQDNYDLFIKKLKRK